MNINRKNRRVLLLNLYPSSYSTQQAQDDATEMYYLVESLGDATVVEMVHQRGNPSPTGYFGMGKAEEASAKILPEEIDIIAMNGIAKPQQLENLWQLFSKVKKDIVLWDRVDLILQIFSKHANTAEAKLQIELANMRHMGPKIYGMGMELSQQGGGIGTRGIGETNVELMKRHWRDAMMEVKKKLDKLEAQRLMQIDNRKQSGLPTVSIIGYTNAGKTTLFNRLTQKGKFADNLLFATLDSTVSKVYLPGVRQEIFVSDTIGFIKNLPPSLIEAFKSTLLESIHADLILHVLDGSSSSLTMHLRVVEDILAELKLEGKDELIVINKSDALDAEKKEEITKRLKYARPLFVSAKTGEGFDVLLREIEQYIQLSGELKKSEIVVQKIPVFHTDDRVYDENTDTLPTRNDLMVGQQVAVVQKEDQQTNVLTEGIIARILSNGFSHPRGIKVELADGTVGRVKKILYEYT